MKKLIIILLVAVLVQSCTSGTASGFFGGSMMGGAIGGLVGGPRGRDLGVLLGGAAGAAAGAAIDQANSSRSYSAYEDGYEDGYVRGRSSVSRRNSTYSSNSNYGGTSNSYGGTSNSYSGSSNSANEGYQNTQSSPFRLSNLRFVDDNNNHAINPEENGQIIFELTNTSSDTLTDIIPYISEMSGSTHVFLSPSEKIATMKPHETIRYTCHLKTDKKIKDGTMSFRIAVSCSNVDFCTLREFSLPTAK